MSSGANITVFTDHANLMRDALIVYIKGTHDTEADAVSRLEYDPSVNQTAESFHTTKVRNKKAVRDNAG